MGCDIHSFIELYVNGRWQVVPPPGHVECLYAEEGNELELGCYDWDIRRNYELFAALAGVRGHAKPEPIVSPRGIPSDLSPEVAHHYANWRSDAHTPSWLTYEDLVAIVSRCQDVWSRTALEPILVVLARGAEEGRRMRMVFWFDN